MRKLLLVVSLFVLACTASAPNGAGSNRPLSSTQVVSTATVPSASASVSSAPLAPLASTPVVSEERAEKVVFPQGVPTDAGCQKGTSGYVRCLVQASFEGHPAEASDALALFDELGDVVGVEKEQDMDGGFRGTIHLVPELPVGQHKRHLGWILSAQRDIHAFVAALQAAASKPMRYRHTALAWRFLRSVGRTTPSAYAADWEVGYNVSGSLHASAQAVRDTVFHEVFHLNDQEHDDWSRRALGPIVDGIVAKCGTKVTCLTPYAPFKTMVRGGTYYAFQPDNGDIAHEYAAELATRYFNEQLAATQNKSYPGGWFKCGPEDNARAMKKLSDEFFGGADLTTACR